MLIGEYKNLLHESSIAYLLSYWICPIEANSVATSENSDFAMDSFVLLYKLSQAIYAPPSDTGLMNS